MIPIVVTEGKDLAGNLAHFVAVPMSLFLTDHLMLNIFCTFGSVI